MTPTERERYDAWLSAGEEREERDERPEDERAEDEAAARDEANDETTEEEY